MRNVVTLLLLGLHCAHAFTLHLVTVNRPDCQDTSPVGATAEHQHLWRLKLDALGHSLTTPTQLARELADAVRAEVDLQVQLGNARTSRACARAACGFVF